MQISNCLKKIAKKINQLLRDNWGGNLVEYALLIGFAIFIFFLIIGVITSMLDWTIGLTDQFSELIKGLQG